MGLLFRVITVQASIYCYQTSNIQVNVILLFHAYHFSFSEICSVSNFKLTLLFFPLQTNFIAIYSIW